MTTQKTAPPLALNWRPTLRREMARFLAAVGPTGADLPGLRVQVTDVNGAPAVVAWSEDRPYMALQLVLADGLVEQVLYVANPEKLAGLAVPPPEGP